MNEQQKFEFFLKIHENLPRQGPGDFESTEKAFDLIKDPPPKPQILDIGCGPGMQTVHLCQISDGHITAVDLYQSFLDELHKKALEFELSDKITIKQMDMNALQFAANTFDVIWSEGSIYIMGFKKALNDWKIFLKKSGYIAVTEISWLKDNIPEQLNQFWKNAYPAMNSIEDNIKLINECGYELKGHFTLPDSVWWDDYYTPLQDKLISMKETYANDKDAMLVINEELDEIDLRRKYSEYYGYVFYIMQREQSLK